MTPQRPLIPEFNVPLMWCSPHAGIIVKLFRGLIALFSLVKFSARHANVGHRVCHYVQSSDLVEL